MDAVAKLNHPDPALGILAGEIIAVTGSRAKVLLDKSLFDRGGRTNVSPYIGTILSVDTGEALVLGMITAMQVPSMQLGQGRTEPRIADVELVGELARQPDGYLRTFRRGVSIYPRLGDRVEKATKEVLEKAYYVGDVDSVHIGAIHQDQSVPAAMRTNDMLTKHFAILGSTGSGKSCTTALILRRILESHENGHIVVLDPHNEYGSCFGHKANVLQLDKINMPYWLLNFEETVEVLLGDIDRNSPEVEILRDLVPVAKRMFGKASRRATALALQQRDSARDRLSVDVPTPYRISDLIALIDEQMGRLEVKKDLGPYKRIKARIATTTQDPRFAFMFGKLTVNDEMAEIISSLFRIPAEGRPITVVQLMGVPSEVLNVIVSVLARMAFDVALWSDGKLPMIFVCEEAHRYVPRDTNTGFKPTRRAISRIAKEGRKYGISLCIVSQRPGDISPAILSQCSTLVTMRLTSAQDQEIVHAAVSDATVDLLDFLPTLGTREALVFGEGFTLPSRIVVSKLPQEALPRGMYGNFVENWSNPHDDRDLANSIVARMRRASQINEDIDRLLADDADVAERAAVIEAMTSEDGIPPRPQRAAASNGATTFATPPPAPRHEQAAPAEPAQTVAARLERLGVGRDDAGREPRATRR